MTSKDLNILLIKFLPEIKSLYDEEVSWQEGDETGSHVVFADILFPYILNCVKNEDTQCLIKCFKIIEKILLLGDEYANEVIALSVLEGLSYETDLKINLKEFMGDKTKQLFEEFLNN